MAPRTAQQSMTPLNIVTLVFIVPFAFILAFVGVSHDIVRRQATGGPVVLWKAAEPCHADDWLCWLQNESQQKGKPHA